MEHEEIRKRFAEQLGEERFEEFLTQLRINLRKAPKLNYWHEQEWSKFCDDHPNCADLELEEICTIFWTEELWNRPDYKPEADFPNLLSIEFVPAVGSDYRHTLEDALERGLARRGMEVLGGGELLDGRGSDISMAFSDFEKDLGALRKLLVKKQVPESTCIVRLVDGDRREYPVYGDEPNRKRFLGLW